MKICAMFAINWHSLDFSIQNMEAEKQLKFFQGCVAAAFAERDNAIMEVMMLLFFIEVY